MAETKSQSIPPGDAINGTAVPLRIEPSPDLKPCSLEDYNKRLVQMVQDRWYALLDDRKFALADSAGKAVVRFNLHSDGKVSEVQTSDLESTARDVLSFLAELAILQSAPFGEWSSEVLQSVGRDTIEMTFTFNYQ